MVKYKNSGQSHEQSIAKGAFVNVLGTIGKVMFPLFFIVITRLYGPAVMGIYFIIYKIIDITVSLAVSGINDGLTMFLSRDMEDHAEKEKKLYNILANGFAVSFLISALIIIAGHFGGLEFLKEKYPQEEVVESLKYMMYVLPFVFVPIIVVAATKSMLIMKYDALLMGFFKPFLFVFFGVLFFFFSNSLEALLAGYFVTSVILTVISLFVFHKHFSFRKLFLSIRNFKIFKPLLTFAFPQSLNITFTTFITNLDILMLGYFDYAPEMIGFYGMGAQIVKNLREVKLAFSGAYAPVIARLHTAKDFFKMNSTYSMISRWTSGIGFPIALLIAVFREELILLFHSSFVYDTKFMVILLVPPLISCTIGLSANILVMTGHSGWNLVNSVVSTGLNGVLNYFLIRDYGLTGAAVATAIASLVVTFAMYYEVYVLEKARLIISRIYKPYVAIALPVFLFTILEYFDLLNTTLERAGFFAAAFGTYVLIYKMLKIEEEDRTLFSFLKLKKKRSV